MATEFVTFTLANYLADWDLLGKNLTVSGRFSRPPGLATATVDSILAAIGATKKNAAQKAPCPPPASFEPRRLLFSFLTGGSLSIPFVQKANAVALGTTLKGLLQGDLGLVTCIKLIGEKWGRVEEELKPAGVILAPGADIKVTTGSKNPVFARSYSYITDNGLTSVQTVRQNTDSTAVPATPFSVYATPITNALGALLPQGCGGVGNITPRHYTAKILTVSPVNPIRQLIVPVAANEALAIRGIGIALATITQTMCLNYEGESDSRFSRLIP
jgi:hypothetical protein